MPSNYNPPRQRNLYDPESDKPFRISRSKIDIYLKCPRCFYLDRKLGIDRPPMPGWSLNTAVDTLLKKEFDIYRSQGTRHPLFQSYGLDVIPLTHGELNKWRDSLRGGIIYLDPRTNLEISGGVDDVWINPEGEYFIVDYKSTSKDSEITLDDEWKESYKRQIEVYQWLFRKNGFKVSKTGYFVYCNGKTDKEAFDSKRLSEKSFLFYHKSISHNLYFYDITKKSTRKVSHRPYRRAVEDY